MPGKMLDLNPKFPRVSRKIQWSLHIYIIVRTIQSAFIFHKFNNNTTALTGDNVVQIRFLATLAVSYYMAISFAIAKAAYVVDIFNAFCLLQILNASNYFKFVFYSSPIVVAILPVL